MALRIKNAVVLAKTETTAGTDASPSASTDAVLVENAQLNFNPDMIETDEVTGSLDRRAPIPGGLKVGLSFDVYLKGSGTPETPPEWGELLTWCGFKEVATSAAVPTSAQAATAGGASAVTLATPFSATAQAYRGMPLLLAVNPSGGATPFIVDWSAGRVATLTDLYSPVLDVTTTCQVPKNVLYKPTSAAADIKTGTLYAYLDGILYKFLGCRGSVSLALTAGKAGKISFNMQGMYGGKSDASVPAGTYDATRPPIWRGNDAGAFLLNRAAASVQELRLETANDLVYPENPNAAEGFDPTEIVRRKMAGSINPLETLVATRDIMADFRAGTPRIIHARYGTTAGNRIGIVVPTAQFTGNRPADRSGLMAVEAPFACVGEDAGFFLCSW